MNGIDVSHNNGLINWELIKQNKTKIDFVFIKATEGVGYIDSSLKYNAENAVKNGFKIGYYHFATLNRLDVVQDATDEANAFLNSIKDLPKNDLPLVLDIERNTKGIIITKDKFLVWINTFFQVLNQAGKEYALYSGKYYLDVNLPDKHNLGGVKLWLAQYTIDVTLPKGWADYWVWQYNSNGTINGIKGNVDVNKTKLNIV